MADAYHVGQSWTYEAPKGFEQSRIIIGAILTFAHHEPVICASVTDAPMRADSGDLQPLTIPFLPFSETAFKQTILAADGQAELPASFSANYKSWKTDQKGLGFINIPFKRLLRDMVDGLEQKSKSAQQTASGIGCIEGH